MKLVDPDREFARMIKSVGKRNGYNMHVDWVDPAWARHWRKCVTGLLLRFAGSELYDPKKHLLTCDVPFSEVRRWPTRATLRTLLTERPIEPPEIFVVRRSSAVIWPASVEQREIPVTDQIDRRLRAVGFRALVTMFKFRGCGIPRYLRFWHDPDELI